MLAPAAAKEVAKGGSIDASTKEVFAGGFFTSVAYPLNQAGRIPLLFLLLLRNLLGASLGLNRSPRWRLTSPQTSTTTVYAVTASNILVVFQATWRARIMTLRRRQKSIRVSSSKSLRIQPQPFRHCATILSGHYCRLFSPSLVQLGSRFFSHFVSSDRRPVSEALMA